jgi:hypothetical protein
MSKLIVYGDSYASSTEHSKGWTSFLAEKLNLQEINRAVDGSSSEYAIEKFINDFKNNIIKDDDIIIFVLSTPGRLNLSYQQEFPGTASQFLHDVSTNNSSYKWYKQNRQHLQWYFLNRNGNEACINLESYIHMLRNFAEMHPNIKLLFLENSDHYMEMPYSNTLPNFLRPRIYLTNIANNEIRNFKSYFDWTSSIPGVDYRINHLSNKNKEILINLVIESLETMTVSNITYDKFMSDLFDPITTKQQYIKYIKDGLISSSDIFLGHFSINRNEL